MKIKKLQPHFIINDEVYYLINSTMTKEKTGYVFELHFDDGDFFSFNSNTARALVESLNSHLSLLEEREV